MERRFTAYKITNTVDGRAYIGITKANVKLRWLNHFNKALREKPDTYLARAILKHGKSAFRCEVIASALSEIDLVELEIILISQEGTYYKNGGYNLTIGGEGRRGGRQTPEEIALRSSKLRGKKRTPEQRAHLSKVLTGLKKSEAHCQALSIAHMGHKRSEESIRKSADFQRGQKRSPETRAKMSAALKGNQNCLGRLAAFCKRGHPRVEGNLYWFTIHATGRRQAACKTCVLARARLQNQQRKENNT